MRLRTLLALATLSITWTFLCTFAAATFVAFAFWTIAVAFTLTFVLAFALATAFCFFFFHDILRGLWVNDVVLHHSEQFFQHRLFYSVDILVVFFHLYHSQKKMPMLCPMCIQMIQF